MKTTSQLIFVSISLVLFFLLIISCKNNENAYIKGQAIEYGSENPIPGLEITLTHGYKDKNGAHQTEIITTTITDQNGFYHIDYHRKPFNDYRINWRPGTNYLPIADSYDITHKKTAHSIGLYGVGYVKIRLKKNSNSNSFVRASPDSPNAQDLPTITSAGQYDTILKPVCRMYSGIQSKVIWDYYENGPNSDYVRNVDYIIINKNDTVTHTIEFN